jgi:hypothetical protein
MDLIRHQSILRSIPRVTVLNGSADKNSGVSDWAGDADNASDWGWVYLHQGGRKEADSRGGL